MYVYIYICIHISLIILVNPWVFFSCDPWPHFKLPVTGAQRRACSAGCGPADFPGTRHWGEWESWQNSTWNGGDITKKNWGRFTLW